MTRTDAQFRIRVPQDVKEWLEKPAAQNLRTQSAEIVAALRSRMASEALPFLRQADLVDIGIVGSSGRSADHADPGVALARWLSRHGIRAEVTTLPRTERRKAEVLAHFAAERSCEALVLGAYGHSRLREMLLGGTTRDLLAEVPLPLLMAH